MKLAEFSISLPLYHIESDVSHRTERKPTVFERMVLRLCDPGLHLPNKQNLLSVFRDQLGLGDVRELLQGCVSELIALGALPASLYAQDMLEAPLTEFKLTDVGLQFFLNNTLPAKSRTNRVWHIYDPISDEIKRTDNDEALLSQRDASRDSTAADRELEPKNLLSQLERAIEQEAYDWKNPATIIERIKPSVKLANERSKHRLEISCSEDGTLSAIALHDTALQGWLEKADPELVWKILLADVLITNQDPSLPIVDSVVLRNASTVRPIAKTKVGADKEGVCIVAQGVAVEDATTPVIVLSYEVNTPELVANGEQTITVRVPAPTEIATGFRSLFLPKLNGTNVQVEVAGSFRIYWAGQPHQCGLAVTLNEDASKELWDRLHIYLECACEHSDDPRIAFMPLAWMDVDVFSEKILQWFSARIDQPIYNLMTLIEHAEQAIRLWRPNREDWKPVWEESLSKSIDESLRHTPNQLDHECIAPLLNQIGNLLPVDKAVSLQTKLLHHATPIFDLESLAKLRSVLLSSTEIPKELLSGKLQQVWLEHALQRKELKLYGPHALQQTMQVIEKAIHDVYRSIGEQALEAAVNGQMDVRTLTQDALFAVRTWREAAEHFHALNVPPSLRDRLDEKVEGWYRLAQEKLAPDEDIGCRFVVFDTSALMEDHAILNDLPSGDIPVIPRRVQTELDGLKDSKDNARATKARAGIRQLDKLSSRIRYEGKHTDLLPAEWNGNKKADYEILSTALFFRLNEVLFVSNDINLRNAAQSLGIKAQDSSSYAATKAGQQKKQEEIKP